MQLLYTTNLWELMVSDRYKTVKTIVNINGIVLSICKVDEEKSNWNFNIST